MNEALAAVSPDLTPDRSRLAELEGVGRLAATLHFAIKNRALALPDDPELLDELAHVRLSETSPALSEALSTACHTPKMKYTNSNFEDWDFAEGRCDMDSPVYDVEADLFLSENYTTVVSVDALRLSVILRLVDRGAAAIEDDRQHVRVSVGDNFLAGMKSAHSRFGRDGRFARDVIESLRRENRKNGRLRLRVLPTAPGFASGTQPAEVGDADEAENSEFPVEPGEGEGLRAEVAAYGEENQTATVDVYGDPALVRYLPLAYFDKILSNLRRGREADELLDRFRGYVEQASELWPEDRNILSGARLVKEAPGEQIARITITLVDGSDEGRLGAVTNFSPSFGATNPSVAAFGLWAVWDAVVQMLSDEEVTALLDEMLALCAYYGQHGTPRIRDLGKGPHYVVTR